MTVFGHSWRSDDVDLSPLCLAEHPCPEERPSIDCNDDKANGAKQLCELAIAGILSTEEQTVGDN